MEPKENLTICADCQNYRDRSFDGKHCAKAKLVSIDIVSGKKTFEKNSEKNDGECADFKAKDWRYIVFQFAHIAAVLIAVLVLLKLFVG